MAANVAGAKRVKSFPITSEELELLQKRQRLVNLHPYTCPYCQGKLIPTVTGWYCSNDAYTQNWFHEKDVDQEFIRNYEEEMKQNRVTTEEMLSRLMEDIG